MGIIRYLRDLTTYYSNWDGPPSSEGQTAAAEFNGPAKQNAQQRHGASLKNQRRTEWFLFVAIGNSEQVAIDFRV